MDTEPKSLMSDLYEPQEKYDSASKQTGKPTIVGILLIISGTIILLIIALPNLFVGLYRLEDYFIMFGIGVFFLVCALVCFVGGYFAFKRKRHKIVLWSSALAIISFVIFGLIAIILASSCEDEFTS